MNQYEQYETLYTWNIQQLNMNISIDIADSIIWTLSNHKSKTRNGNQNNGVHGDIKVS